MSKVLKILSVLIIMIGVIWCSNNVYALNMNLGDNTTTNSTREDDESSTNNSTNTNSNRNDEDDEDEEKTNTNSSQNNTQCDTIDSSPEFTTRVTVNTQELRISNVLSICLIAVGIVLILLAIAILIKLKR